MKEKAQKRFASKIDSRKKSRVSFVSSRNAREEHYSPRRTLEPAEQRHCMEDFFAKRPDSWLSIGESLNAFCSSSTAMRCL